MAKRVIQQLWRWVRAAQSKQRGQSLVELAFIFPILLLMLAGLVEVGYYANNYLTVLDASREGARYAADMNPKLPAMDTFNYATFEKDTLDLCNPAFGGDPDSDACTEAVMAEGCSETGYLYHKAACLVQASLYPLELDLSNENMDVVVSVVAVISGTGIMSITERLPAVDTDCTPDESGFFQGTCPVDAFSCCEDECIWSWTDVVYEGTALDGTGKSSGFTCAELLSLLNSGVNRTNRQNGFVIVEVYYEHEQLLNLPVFSQILPDLIPVRAYSIMPVSAAESTPTPMPIPP